MSIYLKVKKPEWMRLKLPESRVDDIEVSGVLTVGVKIKTTIIKTEEVQDVV